FFQAEDGIRDRNVTGVQTCALPISFQTNFKKMSSSPDIVPIPLSAERIQHRAFNQAEMLAGFLTRDIKQYFIRTQGEKQSKRNRSEERRVGKECRAQWAQEETRRTE